MHTLARISLISAACAITLAVALLPSTPSSVPGHGSVVFPMSRVYRVYKSNPERPNFPLAARAVQIDGKSSYYTWNELSQNVPAAVQANLPPGFDYSPWVPDGQIASGGRTDKTRWARTYAGLDQVSPDWPKTEVQAGTTITVDFLATAPHNPSVWDVWMTRPGWDPNTPLTWAQMEFLGRPTVSYSQSHYTFPLLIPRNRRGHHVLWVAWQRDDPVGEVFFSTSDLSIAPDNDTCAGARPLAIGDHGPIELEGATSSGPAASCGHGGADLWFYYDPICDGNLQVSTCASGNGIDSLVSIWSGTCANLTEIACADNGCGFHGTATAPVRKGQRCWIKVGTRAAPTGASLRLRLSYDNQSGSIRTIAPGCGPAQLAITGAPNPGGRLALEITGATGPRPTVWLGMQRLQVPLCSGCTVGADLAVVLAAPFRGFLPCDPNLVGLRVFAQGADVGAGGGCSGTTPLTLTETAEITIGR